MRGAVLLGLAMLAACDSAPSGAPTAEHAPAAPSQSGGAAADAFDPAATTLAAPERRVTLFADGLLAPGDGGAVIRFGAEQADVVAAITDALGSARASRNEECGAGPMDFAAFGPLTVNFLDGRLVGWHAAEGARVVTADGIALGNTLADIRRERSAALVSGSTLDGEFEFATAAGGTIGGFVKGEGEAARVSGLYAGVNCFFR